MPGKNQKPDSGHIANELLTRYGIFLCDPKEPDYNGKRLTQKQKAAIEMHIQQCRVCQRKLDAIVQDYREIDAYLQQAGIPSTKISVVGSNRKAK